MEQQAIKCPICGKPYVFFAHMVGDQSACRKCRAEAREDMGDDGFRRRLGMP